MSILAINYRVIIECRFRPVLVIGGKGIGNIVEQSCRDRLLANKLVNNIFHRVHSADKIRLRKVKIALIVYRIKVAEFQNGFFHLGKV